MGIKEKDLQTVESLQSGDKIRIVTGGGNSRNIDAGAVGGGALKVTATYNESDDSTTLDKTYNEIANAVEKGIFPIVVEQVESEMGDTTNIGYISYFGIAFNRYTVAVELQDVLQFSASSPDGVLTEGGSGEGQ